MVVVAYLVDWFWIFWWVYLIYLRLAIVVFIVWGVGFVCVCFVCIDL